MKNAHWVIHNFFALQKRKGKKPEKMTEKWLKMQNTDFQWVTKKIKKFSQKNAKKFGHVAEKQYFCIRFREKSSVSV